MGSPGVVDLCWIAETIMMKNGIQLFDMDNPHRGSLKQLLIYKGIDNVI